MSAISFPTNPTRLNYAVNPWVDPSGKPWIWNQSQSSWSVGGGGADPRIPNAITSISAANEQLVVVSGGVTYRANMIPD